MVIHLSYFFIEVNIFFRLNSETKNRFFRYMVSTKVSDGIFMLKHSATKECSCCTITCDKGTEVNFKSYDLVQSHFVVIIRVDWDW